VDDCGAPCYKLFFSGDDVKFVRNLVGLTSLTSTLACLWALLTFAVLKLGEISGLYYKHILTIVSDDHK
jgi:hypothetical protein